MPSASLSVFDSLTSTCLHLAHLLSHSVAAHVYVHGSVTGGTDFCSLLGFPIVSTLLPTVVGQQLEGTIAFL